MDNQEFQKFIGTCDLSVAEAMRKIDINSSGILFLTDPAGPGPRPPAGRPGVPLPGGRRVSGGIPSEVPFRFTPVFYFAVCQK